MKFASIILFLFHPSFCQRVFQEDVATALNDICPKSTSESTILDYYLGTNARIETLEKKVNNVLDTLNSIRLSVGYSMCRSGYEYYQPDKFCYKFFSDCKTWAEARKVCQEEGGDLISLKEGNLHFFRTVVRRNEGSCNGAWVGATDIALEGKWDWLNGEKITSVFWSFEQPDNWEGNENCGDMTKNFDYFLNDEKCDTKLHFICQMG